MSYAAPKLPLCSHATPQNPTIPTRSGFVARTKTFSVDPIFSHRSLSFPFSIPPSNPHSPFLPLPIYPLPRISCSRAPDAHVNGDGGRDQQPLLESCVRTLAAVLVGSLFFLARLGCRPALSAVDAQRSSTSGAPVVEKVGAQDGVEQEDDELAARLLETNPRDVEALKMALYAKMRKGGSREALGYVERLIDVEPEEVEWRLLQALIYELMGRFSRAKQLFKDILEERPLLLRALHKRNGCSINRLAFIFFLDN